MCIDELEVFSDFQLIIRQINGQYKIRNARLMPVYRRTKSLMTQFFQGELNHLPRSENNKADALAKLVVSLIFLNKREPQTTIGECHLLALALGHFDERKETNMVSVFEVKEEADWRQPLVEYVQHVILCTDPKKRIDVK